METTNNRQKPVKGKTILTKYKSDERITLEELAEEYGWETKKFFELLKKAVGSATFNEVLKTNNKRLKKLEKKNVNDIIEEDIIMKARISNNKPIEQKTNLNFNEELKMRTLVAGKKESSAETTISLEKLNESKAILDAQIKSKAGDITSQELLIQMAIEERDEAYNKVTDLQKQLSAAETELEHKESELEELKNKLEIIHAKAAEYKKQLEEIEAQISKMTTVYLIAPYFKGKLIKDATSVSSQPKKKTDGTVDTRVQVEEVKDVSDFGISAFDLRNLGYKDLDRFYEDCAFVCLVRSYKESGKNFKVQVNKAAPVNNLLNRVLGEGEW